MIDEAKADEDFLLEQLVLEVISIYKQIDRQRDELGIVTQWGVGFGETKPVADNKTKDGRKKNRRIVAVIRAHELQEIRSWSVY